MQIKRHMAFHFKTVAILAVILWLPLCLSSCLSYQILREIDGSKIVLPEGFLEVGVTTLADTLTQCGAPREVQSLNRYIALKYQRTITRSRRLSLSLPFYNTFNAYDISANGGLSKSDTLILVFTPQGTLNHYTYEQESQDPFFKTLFQE